MCPVIVKLQQKMLMAVSRASALDRDLRLAFAHVLKTRTASKYRLSVCGETPLSRSWSCGLKHCSNGVTAFSLFFVRCSRALRAEPCCLGLGVLAEDDGLLVGFRSAEWLRRWLDVRAILCLVSPERSTPGASKRLQALVYSCCELSCVRLPRSARGILPSGQCPCAAQA